MVRLLVVEGYGVRIGVRRGCVVVKSASGSRIVPLSEIDRVVIVSSGVSITSSALRAFARSGVDILVLDSRGVPMTSLCPPWITRTVDTRRAQYIAYASGIGLEYAKSFAIAKILNQGGYLRYLGKRLGETWLAEEGARVEEKANEVLRVSGDLESARKSIIGIEGVAARIYWGAIATLIPRELGFEGRDQDGDDPVNKCLNYMYGILYSECFKRLAQVGLDPFAGFLHVDRSGKPVLVFDFIEMFRVSAVDSTLLEAIRRGFRPSLDRDLLSRETRGRLVEMLFRGLERRCRERGGEAKTLREHIKSHALKLARALRSSSMYRGFVEEWWR
ncbi:MAG: CRISPR-associated endonuclease Cas1 [Crenarchaeota archaeon]|nr:CRISPR-associated endonuclease Cas1 [Thermoproteota archaeon]